VSLWSVQQTVRRGATIHHRYQMRNRENPIAQMIPMHCRHAQTLVRLHSCVIQGGYLNIDTSPTRITLTFALTRYA